MAYAEWKAKRHDEPCVFEMFFRKNPFKGRYAIAAGHDEIYRFLDAFKFTEDHLVYLKNVIPQAQEEFLDWLRKLDCKSIKVSGAADGEIIFPE